MANEIINVGTRFTALDYKYKDKSTADEIMIDKDSGELFYKRKDNSIISLKQSNLTITGEYDESSVVISELGRVISKSGIMPPKQSSGDMINYKDESELILNKEFFKNKKFILIENIGRIVSIPTATLASCITVNIRPEDNTFINIYKTLALNHFDKLNGTNIREFSADSADYNITIRVGEKTAPENYRTIDIPADFNKPFVLNSNVPVWATGGNMLTGRQTHGMSGNDDNNTMAFGGSSNFSTMNAIDTCEEYINDVWSASDNMPVGRYHLDIASNDSTIALSIGGYKSDNTAHYGIERIKRGYWTTITRMAVNRERSQSSGSESNTLICAGFNTVDLLSTEMFNGIFCSLSGSVLTSRFGGGCSGTPLNMNIFGGARSKNLYTNYNPVTENFNGAIWSIIGYGITPAKKSANTAGNSPSHFMGVSKYSSILLGKIWSIMGAPTTSVDYGGASGDYNTGVLCGGKTKTEISNNTSKITAMSDLVTMSRWLLKHDKQFKIDGIKLFNIGEYVLPDNLYNKIVAKDNSAKLLSINYGVLDMNINKDTVFQDIGTLTSSIDINDVVENINDGGGTTIINGVEVVDSLRNAEANIVFLKGDSFIL